MRRDGRSPGEAQGLEAESIKLFKLSIKLSLERFYIRSSLTKNADVK